MEPETESPAAPKPKAEPETERPTLPGNGRKRLTRIKASGGFFGHANQTRAGRRDSDTVPVQLGRGFLIPRAWASLIKGCKHDVYRWSVQDPQAHGGLRDVVFQLVCSRNMSHIRDNAHMHAGLPGKVKSSHCETQKTFGVCLFKSCCDHCWQPCHRWPLCECRGHKGHNLCSAAQVSSLVIVV